MTAKVTERIPNDGRFHRSDGKNRKCDGLNIEPTERIPNDERSGKVTERIIRATDGTIEVTESPAKAKERIPNDGRSRRSDRKNRQSDG